MNNTTFLSSEGGIGRVSFILRLILLTVIAGVISNEAIKFFEHPEYFHHGAFGTLGVFFAIVTSLICLMAGLMQLLKRLRDMGKEAYLTLLMLVPGVNVFFLLYACITPSKSA